MNIKNIILRTILTLLATLFGISYGSGLFCMYSDFFGPQYPNPDEQNMLFGYFLMFNFITVPISVLTVHLIYNRCQRKR